jgi:hypothetical protein
MNQLQGETKNTNNIMEAKLLATQRSLASCEAKFKKLDVQYKRLVEVSAELEVKLDEEEARVVDVCHIRHTEERYIFALTYLFFQPIMNVFAWMVVVAPHYIFSNTNPILTCHKQNYFPLI